MARSVLLALLLLALLGTAVRSDSPSEDARELRWHSRSHRSHRSRSHRSSSMRWLPKYLMFYGTMRLKTNCQAINPANATGTPCEVPVTGDYMCLLGGNTTTCGNSTMKHPSTKCDCVAGRWSCAAFDACNPKVNPYIPAMEELKMKMANRTVAGKKTGGRRGKGSRKRGGKRGGKRSSKRRYRRGGNKKSRRRSRRSSRSRFPRRRSRRPSGTKMPNKFKPKPQNKRMRGRSGGRQPRKPKPFGKTKRSTKSNTMRSRMPNSTRKKSKGPKKSKTQKKKMMMRQNPYVETRSLHVDEEH